MSKDLRNKLIRLAHAKPELRKDLLPLLQTKKADHTKKADYDLKIVSNLGAAIAESENAQVIFEESMKNLKYALQHYLSYPSTKGLFAAFKKGFESGKSRMSLDQAAKEMGSTLGGQPATANALSKALLKGKEKSAGRALASAYDKAQKREDEWAEVIYDDDGLY